MKNDVKSEALVPNETTPTPPLTNPKRALTQAKKLRLAELEEIIKTGKETFIEVGLALAEIRTFRLYKPRFRSFESYCEEKWDFKGAHAKRLIEAAAIAQELAPIGAIVRESHARELARVPVEKRNEVLSKANELAKASGHKVTAKLIAATARGESVVDLPPPPPQPTTQAKLRKLWDDATPAERKRFLTWLRRLRNCAQPRRAAPVEIRLGATTQPISNWNQLPVQVCEWLLAQGRSLPAVSFVRTNKQAFPPSARLKGLSNGAWLELGDDRQKLVAKTRRLLAAAGNLTCVVRLQDHWELPLDPLPRVAAPTSATESGHAGYVAQAVQNA